MPQYMKSLKCSGPSCKGCSSPSCMSEGGEVEKNEDEYEPRETLAAFHPEKHQRGVHETNRFGDKGVSTAGADQRNDHDTKPEHKRDLGEMRSMKKPELYSKGGCVGPSCMGCSSPSCMAKGGEVSGEMHLGEHEEPDGDEGEIHGLLGEELLGAIERKDKKAILDCIEACVMNCMGKES